MVNHPRECHLDTPLHSSYMILQTRTFNRKIVSIGVDFLHTPLHELAFYSFIIIQYACFPYISTMLLYISTKFMLQFILCIPYLKNLQAKISYTIHQLTTEHTLYSRVKLSIAQNITRLLFLQKIAESQSK